MTGTATTSVSTPLPPPIQLHHEWIAHDKNKQKKTVVFLHGLLGSGKNLRSFAHQFVQQHAHLSVLLLDLRGHGRSPSSSSMEPVEGDIFATCLHDVFWTLQQLQLTGASGSPVGMVGHSFGGRLALQYTHALSGSSSRRHDGLVPPAQTWLLDTKPGAPHESVAQVIEAVAQIPLPVSDKKEMVRFLIEQQHLDAAVANWMTTNLVPAKDGGYQLSFDLQVARQVLHQFPQLAFLEMLQETVASVKQQQQEVHLVRGGRNASWTADMLKQMQALENAHPASFKWHELPKAGHWVHVDNLPGLVQFMHPSFASLEEP